MEKFNWEDLDKNIMNRFNAAFTIWGLCLICFAYILRVVEANNINTKTIEVVNNVISNFGGKVVYFQYSVNIEPFVFASTGLAFFIFTWFSLYRND